MKDRNDGKLFQSRRFFSLLLRCHDSIQMQTCMFLLLSDSSSAVASSTALVSVDGSRYAIILAAEESRKQQP